MKIAPTWSRRLKVTLMWFPTCFLVGLGGQTYLLDFNESAPDPEGGGTWNLVTTAFFTEVTGAGEEQLLVDTGGDAGLGILLAVTDPWEFQTRPSQESDFIANAVTPPDWVGSAAYDYAFLTSDAPTGEIVLRNLDDTKAYDIELYVSRADKANSRLGTWQVKGIITEENGVSSYFFDAVRNERVMTWYNMRPVNGDITITGTREVPSSGGYLNAIRFTVVDQIPGAETRGTVPQEAPDALPLADADPLVTRFLVDFGSSETRPQGGVINGIEQASGTVVLEDFFASSESGITLSFNEGFYPAAVDLSAQVDSLQFASFPWVQTAHMDAFKVEGFGGEGTVTISGLPEDSEMTVEVYPLTLEVDNAFAEWRLNGAKVNTEGLDSAAFNAAFNRNYLIWEDIVPENGQVELSITNAADTEGGLLNAMRITVTSGELEGQVYVIDFGTVGPDPDFATLHWNEVREVSEASLLLPVAGAELNTPGLDISGFSTALSGAEPGPIGSPDWVQSAYRDAIDLSGSEGSLRLSGLDDARRYRIAIYLHGPETTSGTSSWSISGAEAAASVDLDASGGALHVWTGLAPQDGIIEIGASGGPGTAYLAALELEDISHTVDPEFYFRDFVLREELVDQVLTVDGAAPEATDQGSGAAEAPFATIEAALAYAKGEALLGRSSKVWIRDGYYHEAIDLVDFDTGALLVMEAETPGGVVITGSEPFVEWQDSFVEGALEHEWLPDFGQQPNPWPGLLNLNGEGTRRELLFIDGRPLYQVERSSAFVPGTYIVVDENDRIYLKLPASVASLEGREVRVSTLPQKTFGEDGHLLRLQNCRNLVLRGLVFEHGASPVFNTHAVTIAGGGNMVLENIHVRYNNGCGLGFIQFQGASPENIKILSSTFDRNGAMGLTGGGINVFIRGLSANQNNWRAGTIWGATGWAPCGFKFSGMDHLVMEDLEVNANHAAGIWLDDDNAHVLLRDAVIANNFGSGVVVEANAEPIHIRRIRSFSNGRGLNAFDNKSVWVEDSYFVENTNSQFRIAGSEPATEAYLSQFPEDRRGRLADQRVPEDWHIARSVAGGTDASAGIVDFFLRNGALYDADNAPLYDRFFATSTISEMTYFHPDGTTANVFEDNLLQAANFTEWSLLMPSEASSEWVEQSAFEAIVDDIRLSTWVDTVGFEPYLSLEPFARYDPFEADGPAGSWVETWLGWVYHGAFQETGYLYHLSLGWVYVEAQYPSFIHLYLPEAGWYFGVEDFTGPDGGMFYAFATSTWERIAF